MARTELILTVLVSSPSDLAEERQRCFDVIEKINREWAGDKGVRLEPLLWEKNAYSAMGTDPQAVLNDQLRSYDVFIGIMWHRFGTPTARSGSGTVEEFLEAKRRFLEDSQDVEVSFYFKDAPIAPSALNPDQLTKVLQFKASMSDHGELYREFSDLSSLEDLLRIQLSRQLQRRGGRTTSTHDAKNSPTQIELVPVIDDDADDSGLLDLILASNQNFDDVTQIVGRLSDGMITLATKTTSASEEIQAMVDGPVAIRDPKPLIAIFGKVAEDMDKYADQIDLELPQYRKTFRNAVDSTVEGMALGLRLLSSDQATQKKSETEAELGGLVDGLRSATSGLTGFRSTLVSLPPLSKMLNKSRGRLVRALDELLEEWRQNVVYVENLLK